MSDTTIKLQSWLPDVCHIAYEAGQLISKYYHQKEDIDIEHKADGSPVTEADHAADAFICQALSKLTPSIPLVTEESVAKIPFEDRQAWSTYWLVDPLDGTKEFIAKTDEYSVNIALIHNHKPVLGVVYGTELGSLYFAYQSSHEASQNQVGKMEELLPSNISLEFDWQSMVNDAKPISVAKIPNQNHSEGEAFKVAVSRRHGGALQRFMGQLGQSTTVKMGSALKTCLVAEGEADVYPRFGPTSLWDTGAAQCILEVAGGGVLNAAGHSLEYVQTESLLTPFFIAVSDTSHKWPSFPEIF